MTLEVSREIGESCYYSCVVHNFCQFIFIAIVCITPSTLLLCIVLLPHLLSSNELENGVTFCLKFFIKESSQHALNKIKWILDFNSHFLNLICGNFRNPRHISTSLWRRGTSNCQWFPFKFKLNKKNQQRAKKSFANR